MLNGKQIKALAPMPVPYSVKDGHGLALEVNPTGSKRWRYRYRLHGRAGKLHLGRWPDLSLADARVQRDALAAGIRTGLSPAELRHQKEQDELRGMTVKEFSDKYQRDIVSRTRKNPCEIRRIFERDIYPTIGARRITTVKKGELRDLIFKRRDEGRAQSALALRNVLKRLWDYAIECEVCENNPAASIKPKFIAPVSARDHVLSVIELEVFLRALNYSKLKPEWRVALELILLTLTRKSEVRRMKWEHINFDRAEWEIPKENSKTEAAQIVYLSRQAVTMLETLKRFRYSASPDGFVFRMPNSTTQPIAANTLNRALKLLKLKIQHFTVHDLRRTAATMLAEKEYDSDVIEKALNHKIKGVRGVYNRAQYATQRRQMLQAWADHLDELRGSSSASQA